LKIKVIIIGAGFFGLYIAEFFAKSGHKVTVLDKGDEAMSRASYVNQARVHNGYHYPRSILTAMRSRISFPLFNNEFADCISSDFDNYYMVGGILGKVTSTQFERFCSHIGAESEAAPKHILDLVNPRLIEGVYKTKEYTFDSKKLKKIMLSKLDILGVKVIYGSEVIKVEKSNSKINVAVIDSNGDNVYQAEQVFNCSYAMLNSLSKNSSLDFIPLKHEITEMCLVKPPEIFEKIGVTVMCGPFFSFMPFPSRNLHSFSHVRYTPHFEWHDSEKNYVPSYDILNNKVKKSAWRKMLQDSKRYIPALNECKYEESIWEVKTVLPSSESNDARPILFKKNHGIKGYHCIMGGKIDNVFDAVSAIKESGLV
jgi:glycine/D-amino acid oxidase-like deaminating enzyme